MGFAEEVTDIIRTMKDVLVMYWDVRQGWNVINGNCMLLAGREKAANALSELMECVQPEDRETYQVFLKKIMAGMKNSEVFVPVQEERVGVSVHMKAEGGNYSYYKVECFLMKDDMEAIVRMNVVVCGMNAEEIYRLQLAQNITNDRTPTMFIKAAQEVINKAPEESYALIQFDVAKFKAINEMYGESFGDSLLNFFIESLQIICNQNQLYVRLTADVFMILTAYETKEEIIEFIDRICKDLSGFRDVEYRLVFGVAWVEDIHVPLRQFGDRAALARQSIKSNALQRVAFYEESLTNTIMTNKYIEDHMEKALMNHEFVMYLQPKYQMETNKLVGAEALVRWIQPGHGMVSPNDFVPVFEKNGFVTKMDNYIWEEACRTIAGWRKSGKKPVPVSVNLSRVHLRRRDFIETLNRLIQKYQIPKELLEIEITESVEEQGVAGSISLLKENGYTLLMDDFGSGYSSLNTLKDTQFDVLKIDREFLQDFIETQRGQTIVEHTIQMTRSIGMELVAEGVETEEQAQFLLRCGCNVAQGFYYAKPMPVEEFEKLME